jgi:hypothetical protein
MSEVAPMNINIDRFYGAVASNLESIRRTLNTGLADLGVAMPPQGAFTNESLERLGQGRWGAVFSTNAPGWVWKVSGDPDEGPVVANIVDDDELRDHPGICYYGGIWRFRPDERQGLDRLFLILREELLPVDALRSRFTAGEERADDLLDEIIEEAEWLNVGLDAEDTDDIEQAAWSWGTAVGELSSIRETRNVAEFMLEFLARAGGALADAHRSNCGVRRRNLAGAAIPAGVKRTHRANKRKWTLLDPGVSRTHHKPRIPLISNPSIPFLHRT